MIFHSTILTAVNLLNGPLNIVGQGLPTMLAAYASVKRIQTFLEMDEKPIIASDDSHREDREPRVDAADDTDEKSESFETLTIEHASFSWLPDSPTVLKGVTLSLLPGKLHMCVGPVASVRLYPLSVSLFERKDTVVNLL